MAKSNGKPKELKPWGRRPWPKRGARSQERLYAAVGRALSEWERYEATLSFVFANFVTLTGHRAARRAYSAVRTFEGRAEMLRAASEAYFSEEPDDRLLEEFKEILRTGLKYVERRNEIAHAAVDHFRPAPPKPPAVPLPATYALFPSFASFRNRTLDDTPTYCYTVAELEYFRVEFFKLRRPAIDVSVALLRARRERASRGKLRSLYRASTSREPG